MTDELHLYVSCINGVPQFYAFGEPWIAQALLMDDIRFRTPEEAWESFYKCNKGSMSVGEMAEARKRFESELEKN